MSLIKIDCLRNNQVKKLLLLHCGWLNENKYVIKSPTKELYFTNSTFYKKSLQTSNKGFSYIGIGCEVKYKPSEFNLDGIVLDVERKLLLFADFMAVDVS